MFIVTTEVLHDGVRQEVQIGTALNEPDKDGKNQIHIFLTHALARGGECLMTLWDQSDLEQHV